MEPSPGSEQGSPTVFVAVANQKGGVGKSTTAINLGAALAFQGERVLVVDLDPQANTTSGLGIEHGTIEASVYDVLVADTPIEDVIEPTSVRDLYVVPSSIDLAGAEIELVSMFSRELRLATAIKAIEGDYSVVVVDCPPSLGLLTVNALAAVGEVLIPVQCEYYALEGVNQLLRNVHLVQQNINPQLELEGVILTMFDGRTTLSADVVDQVRAHFGDTAYRTVIPRTVRLSEAPSYGEPIEAYDPMSRGAIAYRELGASSGGAMAARKSGLGRGLESLIPVERPEEGFTTLPLEQVTPNPHQPRSRFDDDGLASLAASIREVGALQPIVVRAAEDGYELIAGERRWRAARIAGLAEIPAVVRQTSETGTLVEALIENVQREDLTPLEEASAYQELVDSGMIHDEVAKRVGKSRTAVTNTLRLLQLPAPIQGMLNRGELSAGHARALLGVEDVAYAQHVARRAAAEGWSVRQIEDAVRARVEKPAPTRRRTRGERPAAIIELEERLGESLGAPVKIDYGGRKGKIVVPFSSLDDLERVSRHFLSS